jgi:hypothetical protein
MKPLDFRAKFIMSIHINQSKGTAQDAYYGDLEGMYEGSHLEMNGLEEEKGNKKLQWLDVDTGLESWSLLYSKLSLHKSPFSAKKTKKVELL